MGTKWEQSGNKSPKVGQEREQSGNAGTKWEQECLQPAPLKLALACITRGNSRKHQAAACEIRTAPTVPKRSWASPEPQVPTGNWASPEPQVSTRSWASPAPQLEAGHILGLFCGFICSCLFWVFPVLENIIKMTANATVVNTN